MLAKTKSALIEIPRLFKEKKIQKKYFAIVHGDTSNLSRVDDTIDGKASSTLVETKLTVPSRMFGKLSLVELSPLTGRTHQLRIHMQAKGHLILGDKEYAAGQKTVLGKGLFLCAAGLSFVHPFTKKELDVALEIPNKFIRVVNREKDRYKK
jgi:23S rRNA-/tRNA-specific pseudouridylate synthase